MDNGWVKLHRRLLNNKEIMRSDSAFKLFVTLLLLVDKRTGQWAGGRFQLAEMTSMHESKIYRTLIKLKNLQICTLEPNNKYTTISILNWHKYQENRTADRTTIEQQAEHSNKKNTTRIKNIYNKNENQIIQIHPEVKEIIGHYMEVYGIKTLSKQTENIRAARDLLQDYGLDKVLKAIDMAHEASGQEYAPMIGNLSKLKEKYSDLRLWYKRHHQDPEEEKVDEIGEVRSSLGKVIKKGE